MTHKRINELADFFYSSDSSRDVPFRLTICYGMGGFDLTQEEFIDLMLLLNNSKNIKEDCMDFIRRIGDE